MPSNHTVSITHEELVLLELIRGEPQLVENLRKCTAAEPHQRNMLERLRKTMIRAVGAQRGERARRTRVD